MKRILGDGRRSKWAVTLVASLLLIATLCATASAQTRVSGNWSFGRGSIGFVFGGFDEGYNPQIEDRTCRVLELHEGAFAALVMIVAGLIAIVAAAIGAYRMALSCIVIGCGSWILLPIIELFFGPLMCSGFSFGFW